MRRTHRPPAKSIRCTSICLCLGFISLSVTLVRPAASSSAVTAAERNGQRNFRVERVPAKPPQQIAPVMDLANLDQVKCLLGKPRVRALAGPAFRFLSLKFSRGIGVRSDVASEAHRVSARMSVDFLTPPVPQSGSSKIVFATNRDGSMQIYTMNADGSGRPTELGGTDGLLYYRARGRSIIGQGEASR